jgi:NAD+ kinase
VTTLGFVIHDGKQDADEVATRLERLAKDRGLVIVRIDDEVPDGIDIVLGVGGDGTVLKAARLARQRGLPVAGINVGRVGYLAEFEVEELEALVAAIAEDRLYTFERMTVQVAYPGGSATGLNDVVVEKVASERIIEVGVSINGNRFARYRTDGIIVATPVGSTAYSLSAGGPVVDPELEVLVMTPVAPHSLLSRSLVVAADAVIEISVEIDRPARVNVDGRKVATVEPGESVAISRGEDAVTFLTLKGHPFPDAVRHQFGLDHA